MKAMALNSTESGQATVAVSQLVSKLAKSISAYAKKEDVMLALAVVCALVVLLGVAIMKPMVMVAGVSLLVVAVAPTFCKWCEDDCKRDL